MLRLTWDGPDALLKSLRPTGTKQRQRVYRWENKWGFLMLGTDDWLAESRLPVAHAIDGENRYLLEAVECSPDEAPPFEIDDVWEEDVVVMGGGSMATKCMSCVGNKETLNAFVKKHGLILPPDIASQLRF